MKKKETKIVKLVPVKLYNQKPSTFVIDDKEQVKYQSEKD